MDSILRLEAKYRAALAAAELTERKVQVTLHERGTAEKASTFMMVACDRVRGRLYGRFENLVNLGLHAIFGKTVILRFVSADRARRIHEHPRIFRKIDGTVIEVNLVNDDAGGLVDVVSFLLRLAMLVTISPPPRKFLMMDEPFKHLSAEYCPLVADIIADLAERLDIQILMTTHNPYLVSAADVVYRLSGGEVKLEQSERTAGGLESPDARQGGGVG